MYIYEEKTFENEGRWHFDDDIHNEEKNFQIKKANDILKTSFTRKIIWKWRKQMIFKTSNVYLWGKIKIWKWRKQEYLDEKWVKFWIHQLYIYEMKKGDDILMT